MVIDQAVETRGVDLVEWESYSEGENFIMVVMETKVILKIIMDSNKEIMNPLKREILMKESRANLVVL